MKTHTLNADKRIFLIKFQFKSTNGKFICYGEGIPEILKENEDTGHGVEFIKEFDPEQYKFKRIRKGDILAMFVYNSKELNYLENHHYFKR